MINFLTKLQMRDYAIVMSSVLKQASILKVFLRIMLVIQGQNTCPYVSCREETKQRPKFLRKSPNCQGHISLVILFTWLDFFFLLFLFFFFFFFWQRVAPSSSSSIRCKLARRVTILSLVFISSVRLHGRT